MSENKEIEIYREGREERSNRHAKTDEPLAGAECAQLLGAALGHMTPLSFTLSHV
jgi:hypothetical protein